MSAPTSLTASARSLVERTTVPRGLPVCVEDPIALAKVATLLAPTKRPIVTAGQQPGARS
jgi:hypothetical protein